MDEIIKILENIGLSEKHSRVYLTLLSLGEATAYRVALKSNLKRPTVYTILEDLFIKGLVLKIPHSKKQVFIAKDLDDYIKDQEEKLLSVKRVLPKIKAHKKSGKSRVLYYEGLEGIKNSMYYKFDQMDNKKFHSFYGNLDGTDPDLLKFFNKWNQEALDKNIKFNIIAPKKDSQKHFKNIRKLLRKFEFEMKFLNTLSYSSDISFEVADNFVRIISAKDLQATIIDNKKVAEALRQVFDIIWDSKQAK